LVKFFILGGGEGCGSRERGRPGARGGDNQRSLVKKKTLAKRGKGRHS